MSKKCFSIACKIAKDADEYIIQGFEKLWVDRDYPKQNVKCFQNKGFIAWHEKEFNGALYNKIYYLYVKPEFRKQGIARRLLASVELPQLLVTMSDNIRMIDIARQLDYEYKGDFSNEFGGKDAYFTKVLTAGKGGPTSYYDFEPGWTGAGDIIEARGMNFNQGNMFKCTFCFNIGRHNATNYERELNKIIYFAQRELKRIKDGS